ncbi:MAG: T9SS type A sorting domain-containing protein [Bacteroidetes bacterium]|nr:T9SS type A sorting domain-containing protein [Bacteroidota bacterium]
MYKINCKLLVLLFLFFVMSSSMKAQVKEQWTITKADSIKFSEIPELKLPDKYKGDKAPLLPPSLDNSQLPYFRPIFLQSQWSCGQASGIGYNFTYEINYLRDLPADIPENQYPTHFTWNFLNGGQYDCGVSLFDSWEIVKDVGCPTVADYGGLYYGGALRWMSGYNEYYNGMHNRLNNFYKINIGTPEGLEILKYWMNDHLDGSEFGGVANFMCASGGEQSRFLPSGTPEEGMYVVIGWGIWVGHQVTIVGYNDSIRYDYNEDGQFTNHLDINDDGIVDMKDWEIGGFKIANSFGTDWGNDGFKYMMYKVAAEPSSNGGLWNNSSYVIRAKENLEPQLTIKLTIKHDSREKIKITAGVSDDTLALAPSKILNFPVFSYQGGDYYMQGGNTEEDKTIEIGLDITPLLSFINSGEEAKYFLLVNENDPDNVATGKIISYSIIDYTNGVNEIVCQQSNIPLNENDLTILSINHTIDFDKINIENEELQTVIINEPYYEILIASGGEEPYHWSIIQSYVENNYTDNFPEINTQVLLPGSYDDGYVSQDIDFSFPFYGKIYNRLVVHTDGFLMFDEQIYEWPYTIDKMLLFKNVASISPFWTDLRIYPGQEDGMWYEGNQDYAIFRWKESIAGQPEETDINFAVKLYPLGNIEFYYGEILMNENTEWIAGISSGDGLNHAIAGISNTFNISPDQVVEFIPIDYPMGLEISDDGVFSGTPVKECIACEVTFMVKDNNNIFVVKSFQISTGGILFDYTIEAGGDEIIEYGETVNMNISVKNIDSVAIENAVLTVSTDDEYITITDNYEYLGTIEPDETVTVSNAIIFNVDPSIPNEHIIILSADFSSLTNSWDKYIVLTAYAPNLQIGNVIVSDGGNGKLDPGETADLIIPIKNIGAADAFDVYGELFPDDQFIIVNESSPIYFGDIQKGETIEKSFSVSAEDYAPNGFISELGFNISANGLYYEKSFNLMIGLIPVLIVDLDPLNHSGPAFRSIIDNMAVVYEYTNIFPAIPFNYKSLFISLGIFFSNYELSSAQGQKLAEYLENGGMIYMEGRETWLNDTQTQVHPMFNMNVVEDNWFALDTIYGIAETFTDGMKFEYYTDNVFLNYIFESDPSAYVIFQSQPVSYACQVAYDAGSYKTIGSSIEFGALLDNEDPSTKEILFKKYLDFFGIEENTSDINENKNISNITASINYPNPFKTQTTIEFFLNSGSKVKLSIYNINGQIITTLANKIFIKGNHKIIWDGKDNSGKNVSEGIYFYKLQSEKFIEANKMILIK